MMKIDKQQEIQKIIDKYIFEYDGDKLTSSYVGINAWDKATELTLQKIANDISEKGYSQELEKVKTDLQNSKLIP